MTNQVFNGEKESEKYKYKCNKCKDIVSFNELVNINIGNKYFSKEYEICNECASEIIRLIEREMKR